ncbi:hypothetical protein LCGC14_0847720 [marine sediment metagenome]|uniref:Uncharacterized protein n=1 Tax=marine sediment metagenome TaxID=412755 RepID=A0A0F9PWH8_9ZZZZ
MGGEELTKGIAEKPTLSGKNYFDTLYKTVSMQVPLNKIALNPQQRIRVECGDYAVHPKYIALKESMGVFGLLHSITLKQLDSSYRLLAGFYRFCGAVDLGWLTIESKIFPAHVSKYDEFLIELLENINRRNFTSYEVYAGIGHAKALYEKAHPETSRGKYNRFIQNNQERKSITAPNAVIVTSKKKLDSFVKHNAKLFGMAERTLFNKTRIAEAILSNKFKDKTIELLKQEKISQTQLLQLLKKRESEKDIKNNSGEDFTESAVNSLLFNPPKVANKKDRENNKNLIAEPYLPPQMNAPLSIHDEKLENVQEPSTNNSKNNRKNQRMALKNSKEDMIKIYDNSNMIVQLNTSIREGKGITNNLQHNRSQNEKETNAKCKSCFKAHVFIIECPHCDIIAKCESCGKPLFIVICQDDVIKRIPRYRNPHLEKCIHAPPHF